MPEIDLSGLDAFQDLHLTWSQRNFPGAPQHIPALGIGEELGELAEAALEGFSLLNVVAAIGRLQHAQIKGEQGIRHSPVQIIEKKMDAIGDVLVYLSDYANKNGLRLSDCLKLAWDEIKDRDWIAFPESGRPPKGSAEAIVDEALSLPDVPKPVTLKDVLEGEHRVPDHPDYGPGPADGGAGQRWLEGKALDALGPRITVPDDDGADLTDDDERDLGAGYGSPTDG